MNTCNHCGGLVFSIGTVVGYAGPICTCRWLKTFGPLPADLVPRLPSNLAEFLRPGKIEVVDRDAEVSKPAPAPPQGWQCPLCKTVHAPFVRACDREHSK